MTDEIKRQCIGYAGIAPCGCVRGFVSTELPDEAIVEYVIDWLRGGCLVRQIMEGDEVQIDTCPTCREAYRRATEIATAGRVTPELLGMV